MGDSDSVVPRGNILGGEAVVDIPKENDDCCFKAKLATIATNSAASEPGATSTLMRGASCPQQRGTAMTVTSICPIKLEVPATGGYNRSRFSFSGATAALDKVNDDDKDDDKRKHLLPSVPKIKYNKRGVIL